MDPLGFILKPGGGVPLMDHLYGAMPPEAVGWKEKLLPIAGWVAGQLVVSCSGDGSMASWHSCAAVRPLPSLTPSWKIKSPASEGTPLNMPWLETKSPEGKRPEEFQKSGSLPPTTDKGWRYALAKLPGGKGQELMLSAARCTIRLQGTDALLPLESSACK